MRLFPLDYGFAFLVIVGTTVAGYRSAQRINQHLSVNHTSETANVSFRLGDERYLIKSTSGCIGDITVRAGGDSVLGVFVTGTIRLSRDGIVLPATINSSFAINPLNQLYEATISLLIATNEMGAVRVKNVRPYEVTVSGFGLSAGSPTVFSIPGPVTFMRDRTTKRYIAEPPDGIALPPQVSPFASLIQTVGVSVSRDTEPPTLCSDQEALNLSDLETKIRSIMPKAIRR